MRSMTLVVWLALCGAVFGMAACGDGGSGSGLDAGPDGSTDADTDADADADGGADSGADTDADADADECDDPDCVVFVDGSLSDYADHDGSAWALAFADVQDGIDAAAALAESIAGRCLVWVADGTYTPTEDEFGESAPANPRYKTFLLRAGVSLYGGFAGGEIACADRDVAANETILSGDLGVAGSVADNAYHVVTGADGAVLDGFTVERGNADGVSGPGDGGGLYNSYASPTVRSCTFTDNAAEDSGGAIYNYHSFSAVTDCVFSGNAAGEGGAINDLSSSTVVARSTFWGNSAAQYGGGLHSHLSSTLVVSCRFEGNSASWGGGVDVESGYAVPIENCVLLGNSASSHGGGLSVFGSSPIVINSTFSGNSSEGTGGAVYVNSGGPIVSNSILWGDSAETEGDEVFSQSDLTSVTYSDVGGGCSVASGCTTDETGNIDADPLFVDAESGDLRLQDASPCIDVGNDAEVPIDTADLDGDGDVAEGVPYDLDGNPRIVGDVVDMGAYEYQP